MKRHASIDRGRTRPALNFEQLARANMRALRRLAAWLGVEVPDGDVRTVAMRIGRALKRGAGTNGRVR